MLGNVKLLTCDTRKATPANSRHLGSVYCGTITWRGRGRGGDGQAGPLEELWAHSQRELRFQGLGGWRCARFCALANAACPISTG